jgi:hypothetical protein
MVRSTRSTILITISRSHRRLWWAAKPLWTAENCWRHRSGTRRNGLRFVVTTGGWASTVGSRLGVVAASKDKAEVVSSRVFPMRPEDSAIQSGFAAHQVPTCSSLARTAHEPTNPPVAVCWAPSGPNPSTRSPRVPLRSTRGYSRAPPSGVSHLYGAPSCPHIGPHFPVAARGARHVFRASARKTRMPLGAQR